VSCPKLLFAQPKLYAELARIGLDPLIVLWRCRRRLDSRERLIRDARGHQFGRVRWAGLADAWLNPRRSIPQIFARHRTIRTQARWKFSRDRPPVGDAASSSGIRLCGKSDITTPAWISEENGASKQSMKPLRSPARERTPQQPVHVRPGSRYRHHAFATGLEPAEHRVADRHGRRIHVLRLDCPEPFGSACT
jgi:hypothetical protein